jgi:hypothetical protein
MAITKYVYDTMANISLLTDDCRAAKIYKPLTTVAQIADGTVGIAVDLVELGGEVKCSALINDLTSPSTGLPDILRVLFENPNITKVICDPGCMSSKSLRPLVLITNSKLSSRCTEVIR